MSPLSETVQHAPPRPWALRKVKEKSLARDQLRTIDDSDLQKLREFDTKPRPGDASIVLTDRGFVCRAKLLSQRKIRQLKRAQMVEYKLIENQFKEIDSMSSREKYHIFKQLGLDTNMKHKAFQQGADITPNYEKDNEGDYFSQHSLLSKSRTTFESLYSSIAASRKSDMALAGNAQTTNTVSHLHIDSARRRTKSGVAQSGHLTDLRRKYGTLNTTRRYGASGDDSLHGARSMSMGDLTQWLGDGEQDEPSLNDSVWQESPLRALALEVEHYVLAITAPAERVGSSQSLGRASQWSLQRPGSGAGTGSRHRLDQRTRSRTDSMAILEEDREEQQQDEAAAQKEKEGTFERLFHDYSPMNKLHGVKSHEHRGPLKVATEKDPPIELLTSLKQSFGLEIKDYDRLKQKKAEEAERRVHVLQTLYDQQQQLNFDDTLQKRITVKELIDLVAHAKSNLRNSIRPAKEEPTRHQKTSKLSRRLSLRAAKVTVTDAVVSEKREMGKIKYGAWYIPASKWRVERRRLKVSGKDKEEEMLRADFQRYCMIGEPTLKPRASPAT